MSKMSSIMSGYNTLKDKVIIGIHRVIEEQRKINAL
jgi:hypothetical protein